MKIVKTLVIVATAALGSSVACRTTQAPGEQLSDARIETAVKASLAKDVKLSTLTNIEVDAVNGVVTLSGLVASEAQKDRAEQVASSVDGVRRVNNNIQVSAGG